MLEMKVTLTAATDLMTVLNNIAAALSDKAPHFVCTQNGGNNHQIENVGGKTQPTAPAAPVNPTPAPTASAQAPGAPLSATPARTAAPAAPAVPVAAPAPTAPAQAPTVPTSAPQYTLEMIANAGSSLIDAGKMDQLMGLLGKFGVASLTELAPENYGAIAGELRALGATI